MNKIKVYRLQGYIIIGDINIKSSKYATIDFIERNELSAVTEDMLEVSPSDVDAAGMYIGMEAK